MPDKRSGPATGPLREVPPASVTTRIVPDPYGIRWTARTRLADEYRRHRHAQLADQLMPLAVYYSTRWPRWWAA